MVVNGAGGGSGTPPDAMRSDADWEQLADYVCGALSARDAAAVRARIAVDPDFAALAAKVAKLWALPVPKKGYGRRGEGDVGEAGVGEDDLEIDVDAALVRLERRLGGRGDGVESAAATDPARETMGRSVPFPARAVRRPPWTVRRPVVAAVGALAALVLVWRVVTYVPRPQEVHYTGGKTGRVVTLPDRSVVTLAPGAFLGTDTAFMHGTRVVYLFGEGEFRVAHDPAHPFVVQLPGARATVLGTTFSAMSDTTLRVSVRVSSGKVAVDVVDADGTSHRLTVLAAGDVQDMSALTRQFAQVGTMLRQAGVSTRVAAAVHDALLRAAAERAAEAARRK